MSHLYQKIAEAVRRRIVAGEFKPGDRLPAVREMARQWHCTPGTVNRAYQELAEQGLVRAHRGSGTRILENILARNFPEIEWANLVNRAERYLLEALGKGHSTNQAQAALAMAVSRWQTLQEQTPADNKPPLSPRRLRFVGSHDLTVELLGRLLVESEPEYHLELAFLGSLGGLIALSRGEADVTGVHLWDVSEDTYNLPFIRRILPSQSLALVTLVYRQLGFIVPENNPQRLEKLSDLTRPGVRWFNRQRGSGTRIWLDEQLRLAGVNSTQIEGYDDEGSTHMAVAQAIHSGRATVGLGIQAAALAYGLSFIPLTEELYQLVVPESVWETPAWQAILTIIRSSQFSATVNELGGYNTEATGDVFWL